MFEELKKNPGDIRYDVLQNMSIYKIYNPMSAIVDIISKREDIEVLKTHSGTLATHFGQLESFHG